MMSFIKTPDHINSIAWQTFLYNVWDLPLEYPEWKTEICSSLLMLTHFFGKNKFYENSVPEIGEKKELNANILKLERSKTKEENKDDLYFF